MEYEENSYDIESVVQECLGIIRMCTVRNGYDSPENLALANARDKISAYFNVPEKNVNELYKDNTKFRLFVNGK